MNMSETTADKVAVEVAEGKRDMDDDSGNTNGLVPLFRRLIRNYGIGLCLVSLALVGSLIAEAALQWNTRPSWIKKVPCVMQPQLSDIEV